jgi:hypothetical protein
MHRPERTMSRGASAGSAKRAVQERV